ncbi:rod-binding protein, partial [Ectopseudomonas khazarica]
MDSRLSAGLLGNGKSPIDSGAFTDLNRLNQFKVGGDSEQNIRKVAQEFESLFMNEMLKAMRSANAAFGEGNFMNSNESKTYQDMYDQQLAVTLSKEGRGIGLADVLVRQMSKIKQPSSRPNPFAQVEQPVAATSAATTDKAADKVASAEGFRDDVALLNRRRLAVPGKLADRLLAGIVPSAG